VYGIPFDRQAQRVATEDHRFLEVVDGHGDP
jgi:hypothetical protein